MDDGVAGVAGDVQHLDAGPAARTSSASWRPFMPPGSTTSVSSRSMCGAPSSSRKRRRAVGRGDARGSRAPPAPRRRACSPARRPRPPAWSRCRRLPLRGLRAMLARAPGRDVGLPGEAREVELDGRAFADLAVDADVAAGLLDEAVDLRSPRPVPTPGGLVVKNGSNARFITSRLMPLPESLTATMTYWPGPISAPVCST